ncbi:1-acyl-sn-glycerol-3-phosphate acyltransferase [Indibacter alkaliphilus LW1]|uniref:1-acyl-sn-glycerol-3-phosphate acyltransferase n=1 Tax=Indibacter alkaliphilus (strain CCUG 57479 / KCTC 22604 / LW1) TaxID=1189612 RepID=S2DMP3_INDAL|nr:lysophospholipid acyltransferase family protein [Indibacter alkaliphilus]EOZ93196.1 1-acyl-sn-glycerol-3-phosphate acyltransferase [Indibacter alkaliphilus LW1]
MKIFQWIYTAYAALMFVLLMIIFGLFIILPLVLSPRGGKISFIFIRLWASTWSFLIGIRYRVHGQEFIDSKKPYIYIFNHRSFIDAPVIPMAIRQEVRAIGKKELSKVPLFGLIVSRVAVWVDRKDAASRKASVEVLMEILKKGISVVVAPEGTRNDTGQTLLPFQKGAFRIAVETGTQIMPMAVIGADLIMRRGSLLMRPGVVHIYFSKPISPEQYRKDDGYIDLAEKCYNRLEAMILTHE